MKLPSLRSKKKKEEKWIEPKEPKRHHETDQYAHYRNPRRGREQEWQWKQEWEGEKGAEKIFGEIMAENLLRFEEIHKSVHPKNLRKLKQEKLK